MTEFLQSEKTKDRFYITSSCNRSIQISPKKDFTKTYLEDIINEYKEKKNCVFIEIYKSENINELSKMNFNNITNNRNINIYFEIKTDITLLHHNLSNVKNIYFKHSIYSKKLENIKITLDVYVN